MRLELSSLLQHKTGHRRRWECSEAGTFRANWPSQITPLPKYFRATTALFTSIWVLGIFSWDCLVSASPHRTSTLVTVAASSLTQSTSRPIAKQCTQRRMNIRAQSAARSCVHIPSCLPTHPLSYLPLRHVCKAREEMHLSQGRRFWSEKGLCASLGHVWFWEMFPHWAQFPYLSFCEGTC